MGDGTEVIEPKGIGNKRLADLDPDEITELKEILDNSKVVTLVRADSTGKEIMRRRQEGLKPPLYEQYGLCSSCKSLAAVDRQKGGFVETRAICGTFGIRLSQETPVKHCTAYSSVNETPLYVLFEQATLIPAREKKKSKEDWRGFFM